MMTLQHSVTFDAARAAAMLRASQYLPDQIVHYNQLEAVPLPGGTGVGFRVPSDSGIRTMVLNGYSGSQLCARYGVKYDKWFHGMEKGRIADELNARLSPDTEQCMVRSRTANNPVPGVTGVIRGFVSPRYTKFDDTDIFAALEAEIPDVQKYSFSRSGVNDRGSHFTLSLGRLDIMLQNGTIEDHDVGLHIMNSEVGHRSLSVSMMVYRLVCTNGMILTHFKGTLMRKRHYFKKGLSGVFSRALSDALDLKDDVRVALESSSGEEIKQPKQFIAGRLGRHHIPKKAIDAVTARLDSLYGDAPTTLFNIIQAVTETAHRDIDDLDKQIELEQVASALLPAA